MWLYLYLRNSFTKCGTQISKICVKRWLIPNLICFIPCRSVYIANIWYLVWYHTTLSLNPNFSCPKSLLKTTTPPRGYSWLSGGRHSAGDPKTQDQGFGAQPSSLKGPEHKNLSKRAKFDQKTAVFECLFGSSSFEIWCWAPNPYI